MPASYPTSTKTFTTRNTGDTIASSHINDLQVEVAAVESDLLNPSPTFLATVTSGINAAALSTGTVPDGRVSGAYTGVTSLSLGANVVANVTTVFVGNSTANVSHTATSVSVANSTNTATLTATSLAIGGTIANTTALVVPATSKVYLDGGGDTYVTESSVDVMDLYAGGANTLRMNSSGAVVTGTLSGVTTLAASGVVTLSDATDASSSTTGALKVAGGLGVAKKLYVGTDLVVGSSAGIGTTASSDWAIRAGAYGSGASGPRGISAGYASLGISGGSYGAVGYNTRFTATSDSYTYDINDVAVQIFFNDGVTFRRAATGTAGNTITWSTLATLNNAGALAWGGGSAISSSSNVGLLNANNSWTGSGAHTFSGYIAGSYSGNLWMQASGSCIFMIDSDNNSTGEAFYWRKNASGSGGTDLMSLTEAGDLSINATSKLYLDGGGDTYITESSANRMDFCVGSGVLLRLQYPTNPLVLSNVSFGVGSGDKIYLDATAAGGGGDTYISESGANTIDFYAGGSLYLRLQNSGGQYFESPIIYNNTSGGAANVVVASGGALNRSTSSIRYKHDIATLDTAEAYAAVMAMRPITYRGKTDEDQRRYVGFVAEEMAEIAPLLATYDEGGESGTPNYVTYDRVTAYLVAVVQKQQAEIDALKAQMKEQK